MVVEDLKILVFIGTTLSNNLNLKTLVYSRMFVTTQLT